MPTLPLAATITIRLHEDGDGFEFFLRACAPGGDRTPPVWTIIAGALAGASTLDPWGFLPQVKDLVDRTTDNARTPVLVDGAWTYETHTGNEVRAVRSEGRVVIRITGAPESVADRVRAVRTLAWVRGIVAVFDWGAAEEVPRG